MWLFVAAAAIDVVCADFPFAQITHARVLGAPPQYLELRTRAEVACRFSLVADRQVFGSDATITVLSSAPRGGGGGRRHEAAAPQLSLFTGQAPAVSTFSSPDHTRRPTPTSTKHQLEANPN